MSEIQTSPEEVSSDAGAMEAEVSASPEPTESVETASEESPTPSGTPTEITTEAPSAEGESTEAIEAASPFDIESWDGNFDNLPEDLCGPAQHIHRNLEGGYTKKFQELSDQRKQFETDRDGWTTQKSEWEESKSALEQERDLFKQILEGSEDPRLMEYNSQVTGLKTDLEDIRSEYEEYQKLVEADIDEQAEKFATQFYDSNREVLDDSEKRDQLIKLIEDDWDPEIALQFIGKDEKMIEMARELREQGTPQTVAVEHALYKSGVVEPHAPRPAARLTSGAESRNNPASVRESAIDAPDNHTARRMAARQAVEWATKIR